jgi:Ca2+-binding RTX toxin-like protein
VSFETTPGPVTVDLLAGVATGYGTDRVVGSTIIGSDHDDTLIAGASWNATYVRGEGGNDIIHGYDKWSGEGYDFLAGGDGDDKLYGKGLATLIGDAGNDLLQVGRVTYTPYAWLHYPAAPSPITAKLGAGTVTGQGTDRLVKVSSLTATPYDDVLMGSGGPNYLNGSADNDVLRGWRGSDYLVGGGSYEMAGSEGMDFLYGGRGGGSPGCLGRRGEARR